jgi:hypothetical protein
VELGAFGGWDEDGTARDGQARSGEEVVSGGKYDALVWLVESDGVGEEARSADDVDRTRGGGTNGNLKHRTKEQELSLCHSPHK